MIDRKPTSKKRKSADLQGDLFPSCNAAPSIIGAKENNANFTDQGEVSNREITSPATAIVLSSKLSSSNSENVKPAGGQLPEHTLDSKCYQGQTVAEDDKKKNDQNCSAEEKERVRQVREGADDARVGKPHGEETMSKTTFINADEVSGSQGTEKSPQRRKLIYEINTTAATNIMGDVLHDIPRHVYFRKVNDGILGDQQRLRDLWRLAELEGINIARLSLNEESLQGLIQKHRFANNPRSRARQMLICFDRLKSAHPELLVSPFAPIIDTRIHLLLEEEFPAALKTNEASWIAMTPVKMEGSRNEINALAADTIDSYVRSLNTIAAALRLSGVRLDATVDVAFLLQPAASSRWLKVVKTSMERSTVRGLLAALLRIAHDLPKQSAVHIKAMEARLSEIMDDLALDGDKMALLASWVEPEKHQCLLSAPDDLMTRAENSKAPASSRGLDGAAAFALQLMWEHPGLSEAAIANFDLARDIVGERGSRKVLRVREARARQAAGRVAEPVSADAEGLLDRLIAVRQAMFMTTTLLLPGNDGRPRSVRSAMEAIYNKIQGVLSTRLTSV